MAIGIRHPNKELWIFFNYAQRSAAAQFHTEPGVHPARSRQACRDRFRQISEKFTLSDLRQRDRYQLRHTVQSPQCGSPIGLAARCSAAFSAHFW